MKTLLFLILTALYYGPVSGQTQLSAEPAYKRIPTIPPFNLVLSPDSVSFGKNNIKKKRALIIMVFSPDCDHCIHATQNLILNIKSFKKTEIVLASSLSYASVQKFYKDLNLIEYPNIHVGYDSNRFLSSFYEVKSFPSIFLYNKKGDFKMDFTDHPDFKVIAEAL